MNTDNFKTRVQANEAATRLAANAGSPRKQQNGGAL
jgi:hypothetical protein